MQEEKAKGGYLIFDVRHQQDLALIAEVVQAERDKLALIQDRLEKIEASIRAMQ